MNEIPLPLKWTSSYPRRMKKSFLITFLIVYSIFFGLLHEFAYIVSSRSILDPLIHLAIKIIFFLGWISIPIGLLSSHTRPQRFKFITWVGYIWMGFFTILITFIFAEYVSFLIFDHDYSYWTLFVGVLVSTYALLKGLKPPALIKYQMKGPASMAGFKLAQISDVHLGMLNLNRKWFEKVLHRINAENPVALAITGDMTDAPFLSVKPILQAFHVLKPEIKKYYITGNHEYINPGLWESEIEQFGIQVLHNDNQVLQYNEAKILMAGVPDITVSRFRPDLHSNPDEALKTTVDVDYRILLAHQPPTVMQIKKEKCDLVLTGHTHGGQIFPFHIFVRMANPVIKGFKTLNNILVFNHQGTGFWGPPMRWFSRSEIVIFEWVMPNK